jgi:tRNA pseudouridine13 synthase
MELDLAAPPLLLTASLPGIGGVIKQLPEDFEVEEIPAYEPSGSGDFLYLWIEKRGLGAEYFVRQIARRLEISAGEVGTAGLKDRHAVTRQMVSVPAAAVERLSQLDGDGIHLLKINRHSNKLRPGHLHGNRFRILIRQHRLDCQPDLNALVNCLRQNGLPNFYGAQRFGNQGETLQLGLALLSRDNSSKAGLRSAGNPFVRKLALSSVQSALFNAYLGRRLRDGLFRQVIAGDVMSKLPWGGLFVVSDRDVEQARFDRRETVIAGPIFGRKTFAAAGDAAIREAAILQAAGLTPTAFSQFGKLMAGTRRHNLVYLDDLAANLEGEGIRLTFTLPAGSYATVLLRELMKNSFFERDD